MSMGPILSSYSSYLQGLDTIRAYGRVDVFGSKFDKAMTKFMDISFWQTVLDRISNTFLMGPAVTLCTIGPVIFFVIYLRLEPALAAVMMMNTQLSMRIVQAILHTVMIEGFMVSAQRLIQV
jgi:hypothetical protein